MTPKKLVLGSALMGSLLGVVLLLSSRPLSPERRLPEPEHLPKTARSVLKQRMQRHGRDMAELMWAVVLIDYASAQKLAERVATEPMLARPIAQDATELNTLLPERFFQWQDRLKASAADVGRAAAVQDSEALGRSYGQLAQTCIGCHQVYLHEPPPRAPAQAPTK